MPVFRAADVELWETLLKRETYVKPELHRSTERLEIQITDFYCRDIYEEKGLVPTEKFQKYYLDEYAADDTSDEEGDPRVAVDAPMTGRTLNVCIFGTDKFGNSVALNVKGFYPHIYIKSSEREEVKKILTYRLGRKYQNCYKITSEKKIPYYNSESVTCDFLKLEFNNANALNIAIRALSYSKFKGNCYETNYGTMIKFIHTANLDATGWVSVDWNKLKKCANLTHCQFEYYCDMVNLVPFDSPVTAPRIRESYDLEATSDDGKFQNMEREQEYIIQNSVHLEYDGFINTNSELEQRGLKRLPQLLFTLKRCELITKQDRIDAFMESARITDTRTVQMAICKILNPEWEPPKLRKGHMPNMIGPYKLEEIFEMIEEPIVIECTSNEELLMAYSMFLQAMDVDIRTGYNIFNYDEVKLKIDMTKNGTFETCRTAMNRIRDAPCPYYSRVIGSSGMGENNVNYFDMPGRVTYDTMKMIQRGFKKYSGYSLDFLLETELKMHKVKFSTNDIIDNYNMGRPENIKRIGVYCMHDSFCTQMLTNTLKHTLLCTALGKQSYANLRTMFINGQGKPLHSVNVYEAHKTGRVFNDVKGHEKKQYGGGTVFDAISGLYIHPNTKLVDEMREPRNETQASSAQIKLSSGTTREAAHALGKLLLCNVYEVDGVFVLDFNSLFPSIIREFNLSQDTIYGGKGRPPNYELYQQLEYIKPNGQRVEVWVMYDERRGGRRGTLPRILDNIMSTRDKYKKLSEEAKIKIDKEVYDMIQQACKVQNNSIYGVSSANISPIYHEHIGPLVTYNAGKCLLMLKEYTETRYPFIRVAYGDTDSNFNAVDASPAEPGDEELVPDHPHNLPPHLGEPYESPNWRPPVTRGFVRRLMRVIALGQKLEKEFNQWLIDEKGFKYIGLKYEKTFPFLYLQTKKHYAGPMYVGKPTMEKMGITGLPQVRRETPGFVSVILNGILNRFMAGEPISVIADMCKETIQALYAGKLDLTYLQMSCKIKPVESYKNVEREAHMVLATILRERDFINAPRTNDRISYVYIKVPSTYSDLATGKERKMPRALVPKGGSNKKGGRDCRFYIHNKTGEDIEPEQLPKMTETGLVGSSEFGWKDITIRIEETEHVRANKLRVDYDYYIEKDVIQRLVTFLRVAMNDSDIREFIKYVLGARITVFGSLDKYFK